MSCRRHCATRLPPFQPPACAGSSRKAGRRAAAGRSRPACPAAPAATAAAADGLERASSRRRPLGDSMRAARVAEAVRPVLRRAVRDGCCVALWQELVGRLGDQWTLATLLAHLTGEDPRQSLQPTLIRHLAAHLDQGLAAWRNPARAQGFLRRLATERRQRLGLGTRRVCRRPPRYRATARRPAAGDQRAN
jgi:hypothetical protein